MLHILMKPNCNFIAAIVFTLKEREKNTSDFIKIKCNKLDNLIFEIVKINQVNWIRIDVEGTELEVLKGSTNIF